MNLHVHVKQYLCDIIETLPPRNILYSAYICEINFIISQLASLYLGLIYGRNAVYKYLTTVI